MGKIISCRLNMIEIRLGHVGLSGGGYPVYSPDTTIKEILSDIELDYQSTAMLWKDWRQTVENKKNLFYSQKNPQYPLKSLQLITYSQDLTLDFIINQLYNKYGEPVHNHTRSIIVPTKLNS